MYVIDMAETYRTDFTEDDLKKFYDLANKLDFHGTIVERINAAALYVLVNRAVLYREDGHMWTGSQMALVKVVPKVLEDIVINDL